MILASRSPHQARQPCGISRSLPQQLQHVQLRAQPARSRLCPAAASSGSPGRGPGEVMTLEKAYEILKLPANASFDEASHLTR
jgi:hypothetical protein